MKTKRKNVIQLIVLGIMSIVFLSCCAGQDPMDITGSISPIVKSTYLWSETSKGDTLIYECAQTVSVNYQGAIKTYTPKAKIVFYKRDDVIPINSNEDATPTYITSKEDKDSNSSSPTIYTYDKEFSFDDGQIITAKAYYEVYTNDNPNFDVMLPFVSINSIDFIDAKSSLSKDKTDEYKVDLLFSFDWMVNYASEDGTESLNIDYLKVVLNDADELLDVTYNQSYEWISDNSLTLILERNEIWSKGGKKTTKYQSPALNIGLSSEKNKTLEVSSFDFTKKLTTTTNKTEDLSKDNWNILKKEIQEKVTFSNSSTSFDDSFVYPSYEVSFSLDDKVFNYDLTSAFSYDTSTSKNNEKTSTLTTQGNLIVASKSFTSAVITILNLKENNTLTPDDETIPAHGRIISHFVSAVFDVSSKVTKKCVIVRYEQGYDWGICEYDEYYPASFTYTQSGYSGFNSAAIEKKGQYRLARAVDTSNAIYWYKENNELVSGIDVTTCKAIGWKNMVDGKYCSKMDGYETKFSSDLYTLTLTAPDGSTRTFKSKKP